MATGREKIVTIIGSSYFQPMADLLDRWLARRRPRPNAAQAGYYENGYAASFIVLLVAVLESYVARIRLRRKAALPSDPASIPNLLLHVFHDLPNHDELLEVFVVRNAIIHNHLWEIDFSPGKSSPMVVRQATRDLADGKTSSYKKCVIERLRRTKKLRLTVNPIRVDRKDAAKVFRVIWDSLLFIESKDLDLCSVSKLGVRYAGKRVTFGQLQSVLLQAL